MSDKIILEKVDVANGLARMQIAGEGLQGSKVFGLGSSVWNTGYRIIDIDTDNVCIEKNDMSVNVKLGEAIELDYLDVVKAKEIVEDDNAE